MFQQEMGIRRKSPSYGRVSAVLPPRRRRSPPILLGNTKLGILYACFFWTLIPEVVSIGELFLIMKRVRVYNTERALEVVTKQSKTLRPEVSGQLPALPAGGQSNTRSAFRAGPGAKRGVIGDLGSAGVASAVAGRVGWFCGGFGGAPGGW